MTDHTLYVSDEWQEASIFEECDDTATAFFSVTWDNDDADPDRIGKLVPTAKLDHVTVTTASGLEGIVNRDEVRTVFGAKTVARWEAQIEQDLREE